MVSQAYAVFTVFFFKVMKNMSEMTKVLILITQFVAVFSSIPMTQKCKLSDSECIKTQTISAVLAFSEGIPELGVDPLDVMRVDQIKIDLAGLKLLAKNIDVKGMKKSVIDYVSVDMPKKVFRLNSHTDISVKGKYKASGRLLILPITGNGDLVIKLRSLEVNMTAPFEVVKNMNGKDAIELKSYKYKFDVKTGASFQLSNLFEGNKLLSDTMLKFMNDNWKILTQEFGPGMLDKPIENVYTAIKTFLRSQNLEDIALV